MEGKICIRIKFIYIEIQIRKNVTSEQNRIEWN
jgi:hypothetical protein